jgi:hypothetical protein
LSEQTLEQKIERINKEMTSRQRVTLPELRLHRRKAPGPHGFRHTDRLTGKHTAPD